LKHFASWGEASLTVPNHDHLYLEHAPIGCREERQLSSIQKREGFPGFVVLRLTKFSSSQASQPASEWYHRLRSGALYGPPHRRIEQM
jgi:hypothetical protein